MKLYHWGFIIILGGLVILPGLSESRGVTERNSTGSKQTVTSIAGTTDGAIIVTYSNGSTAQYRIFALSSNDDTLVGLPSNSTTAMVVHPQGKKIALVDVLSGEVLKKKKFTTAAYSDTAVFIKNLRQDKTTEAVIVGKKSATKLAVRVVSAKLAKHQLIKRDALLLDETYVDPMQTTLQNKTIALRNQIGELLTQVKVKSTYKLAALDETALATRVTLGDGKFSTTTPQSGYVYICHEFPGGGGANQDGSWIHSDYWDYSEKNVTVSGEVLWSNAAVTVSSDGTNRTIASNGLPDGHTTGGFPIAPFDDAYEYDQNPNSISEQSYSLTVPANPTAADAANCVYGQVGIALTGIPIFNSMDEQNRDAVAHEIQDTYGGHPQQSGMYHYHTISDNVAGLYDGASGMTLLGYAFDGYGLFGETEFGKTLRTADLDACHGHTHELMWDGESVELYHYHITKDYPYTVGCFHGTPTVTELP